MMVAVVWPRIWICCEPQLTNHFCSGRRKSGLCLSPEPKISIAILVSPFV